MKRNSIVFILIVCIFYSLHPAPVVEEPELTEESSEQEEPVYAIPGFILMGKQLYPGGLLEAIVPFQEEDLTLLLSADGEEETYSVPGVLIETEGFEPFLYFIQGLDSNIRAGEYVLRLVSSAGFYDEYDIEIAHRDFLRETIPLGTRLTSIRRDSSDRRIEEGRELTELLAKVDNESYFVPDSPGRMHPIRDIFYTSLFGDRRIYEYNDGSSGSAIHTGLDYRAPIGEPIMAPFNGKVVMAKDRIVTGNTIVLEHLPAVYSLYYHLDSIAVSLDDEVVTGDLLGTAGNTGLSTGSHLHWEIRVRTVAVDPELFLEAVLLDRKWLIDILSE